MLSPHWSQAEKVETSEPIMLGAINITSGYLCARIIKEAYRRIGINAQIKHLPAARSLALSSQGKLDGEVNRVFSVGERIKSLVRVPVAYMTFHGKVFTIKPSVIVKSPLDLAKYRSGILNGIVYSEKLTHSYNRVVGNSSSQLLNMLIADHLNIDLVILTGFTGKITIAQQFPNAGIKMADESLMDLPIYHYLHESKKELLPRIEAMLNTMVKSGETASMKEAFIIDYMKRDEK